MSSRSLPVSAGYDKKTHVPFATGYGPRTSILIHEYSADSCSDINFSLLKTELSRLERWTSWLRHRLHVLEHFSFLVVMFMDRNLSVYILTLVLKFVGKWVGVGLKPE